MKHSPYIHPKCGFTLIELLTVIAIIGILAAILIPAVSKVRDSAMQSKKISNYRQYFVANNLYANDNRGYTCPMKSIRNGEEQNWLVLLAPYLSNDTKQGKNNEIYVDPLFEGYDPETAKQTLITGVGINSKLRMPVDNKTNGVWNSETDLKNVALMKLNQITFPERRIFIGDSPKWFINDKQFETTRHEGGNKGMFVRFNGSIELLSEEDAELSITDPAKLASK